MVPQKRDSIPPKHTVASHANLVGSGSSIKLKPESRRLNHSRQAVLMKVPLHVLGALALASAVHAFAPLPPLLAIRPASSALAAYPSTTFDGPAIAAYYNKRPWEVLARLATTATPLGLWWFRVQCDKLTAPLLQRGDAAAQALRVRRGYELKQVTG